MTATAVHLDVWGGGCASKLSSCFARRAHLFRTLIYEFDCSPELGMNCGCLLCGGVAYRKGAERRNKLAVSVAAFNHKEDSVEVTAS
jgi:hypothetical protein